MNRKTKIVCTLGPASESEAVLRRMIDAGMDVARLNFSHGDLTGHKRSLDMVRRLAGGGGKHLAVMADLQGRKIRLGTFENGSVELKKGDNFVLTARKTVGNSKAASTNYAGLHRDVKKGHRIFLNDGLVELEVLAVSGKDVHTKVREGGVVGDRKGVNLPDVTVSASGITSKDRRDLKAALEWAVDMVALSFVRSAGDIEIVKSIMKRSGSDIPVIAKIEKHEAVSNLDEIMESADGVMVARGDLGIEMPLEEIPLLQKRIIARALHLHKPVITATQMLESMVTSPVPTRAEVSDVANAILDGTDAVMLSAETAIGRYPVRAVRSMAKISKATEKGFDAGKAANRIGRESLPVSASVAQAACFLAERLNARMIIAFTESGYTARMISSFRPECPVLGVTTTCEVARRMALYNGILPVRGERVKNVDEMIDRALEQARRMKMLRKGDVAVITAGVPVAVTGATNLIKVHIV